MRGRLTIGGCPFFFFLSLKNVEYILWVLNISVFFLLLPFSLLTSRNGSQLGVFFFFFFFPPPLSRRIHSRVARAVFLFSSPAPPGIKPPSVLPGCSRRSPAPPLFRAFFLFIVRGQVEWVRTGLSPFSPRTGRWPRPSFSPFFGPHHVGGPSFSPSPSPAGGIAGRSLPPLPPFPPLSLISIRDVNRGRPLLSLLPS